LWLVAAYLSETPALPPSGWTDWRNGHRVCSATNPGLTVAAKVAKAAKVVFGGRPAARYCAGRGWKKGGEGGEGGVFEGWVRHDHRLYHLYRLFGGPVG